MVSESTSLKSYKEESTKPIKRNKSKNIKQEETRLQNLKEIKKEEEKKMINPIYIWNL